MDAIDDKEPLELAWIAESGLPGTALARALAAAGWRVVLAGPKTLMPTARVVSADGLPEARLAELAQADRRGRTVWIVRGDTEELRVLGVAGLEDDVVRAPVSAVALARRLERLRQRAFAPAPADRDGLTGLPNLRSFGRVLRQALTGLLPGDHGALVLFDLDHLKSLNQELGHAAGDRVLCAVADRLAAAVTPADAVARFGGDEFALLLVRYDRPSLVREAEALRRALGEPADVGDGQRAAASVSAGLVMLRAGLTEPQLLRQADQALHEAKAQGRDRLVHFELVADDPQAGAEASLRRFEEVTRLFGERMTRMVGEMGQRLVEAARLEALQDPLTGAHNRGYFNERLPREIERARASGRPLAVALLDLDHFHDINATYGWPTGDAVLQRFVQVARGQVRLVDWIARYGGEEFAVVLPDTELPAAMAVVERLRAAVAATAFSALDGRRVPVTLSAGVAPLQPGMADGVALVDAASSACLVAKRTGRDRVVAAGG